MNNSENESFKPWYSKQHTKQFRLAALEYQYYKAEQE